MAEIIVALDFASGDDAMSMVDRLGSEGGFYKVGLELYTRAGPDFVRSLTQMGRRVFLDLKLHDIPNTVVGGVRAAADLGVELLTVHCSGGRAMLEAAAEAAAGRLAVVGVTLLTSLTAEDVEAVWGRSGVNMGDEVLRLGALAKEAGLSGVVASGSEVARLKSELGVGFKVVTPGIRPRGGDVADQARVVTPAAAAASGSDYLVVGRPVTRAEDPAAALRAIREEAAS